MRIVAENMTVAREDATVGRYRCLEHGRDYSHVTTNVELLIDQVTGEHDYQRDGLRSVSYTVLATRQRKLGGVKFTHVKVDF
jgi:hypothetical protein